MDKTRDEIISEIRAAREELKSLGVQFEPLVVGRFETAGLVEILKSLKEQIVQRKKFLGENL